MTIKLKIILGHVRLGNAWVHFTGANSRLAILPGQLSFWLYFFKGINLFFKAKNNG